MSTLRLFSWPSLVSWPSLGLAFSMMLLPLASGAQEPQPAAPDTVPVARLGIGAWAGWDNPGGGLLQIPKSGVSVACGLKARLRDSFYLKLEYLRLEPGIADEALVQVFEDFIQYNQDYQYWDLCLLAGLNLVPARVGRPQPFLEAGAGFGTETFTWTTTNLEGGDVLERTPDRIFFVLAAGGGVGFPVHRRLQAELAVSVRAHWDTENGTGWFDPATGQLIPPEDFEPSPTRSGTIVGGRLGVVWTAF